MKPLRIVLIIPDTHRPYHDRRAYNLMIRIYQEIVAKFQNIAEFEIVILGDYADFYAVSRHGKDPTVLALLQQEIEDVNAGLDELDLLFPFAKKVFIEGNHEDRLSRYLSDKAPALFGITSTEHLLKINQRPNWSFIGWSPGQQYAVGGTKLIARHRPQANTAKGTISKAVGSMIYGDIHKIEESNLVGIDGQEYTAFSVGWLGDKRMDKIFGYVNGHHQWQLGFGLVFVDEETKEFHKHIAHIKNYTCHAVGKIFKG